jgi:HSP20 family protein
MTTLLQAPIAASFRREVDRFLDRFAEGDLQPFVGRWVPPVDVSETDDALLVELEIPGFAPAEVHVFLKDQVMTIRGEKKLDPERSERRYMHRECMSAKFVRTITLPMPVDAARAEAMFRNGMLAITLKKAEEVRGVRIAVQTA